jgi:general secretion pathway protein M
MKLSFAEFWSARDVREQKMLALAFVVMALGLMYAVLIVPAVDGRELLRKKLPALREQVVQMQALSQEVAGYAEQTPPVLEQLSKNNVEFALERNGLKAQSVTITGDFVQVQLTDALFSSAIHWLNEMRKTAHISVSEATITVLAQPDKVDAKLTLQQHRVP